MSSWKAQKRTGLALTAFQTLAAEALLSSFQECQLRWRPRRRKWTPLTKRPRTLRTSPLELLRQAARNAVMGSLYWGSVSAVMNIKIRSLHIILRFMNMLIHISEYLHFFLAFHTCKHQLMKAVLPQLYPQVLELRTILFREESSGELVQHLFQGSVASICLRQNTLKAWNSMQTVSRDQRARGV